jgi:hypothetical protein
VSNLKGRTRNQ